MLLCHFEPSWNWLASCRTAGHWGCKMLYLLVPVYRGGTANSSQKIGWKDVNGLDMSGWSMMGSKQAALLFGAKVQVWTMNAGLFYFVPVFLQFWIAGCLVAEWTRKFPTSTEGFTCFEPDRFVGTLAAFVLAILCFAGFIYIYKYLNIIHVLFRYRPQSLRPLYMAWKRFCTALANLCCKYRCN